LFSPEVSGAFSHHGRNDFSQQHLAAMRDLSGSAQAGAAQRIPRSAGRARLLPGPHHEFGDAEPQVVDRDDRQPRARDVGEREEGNGHGGSRRHRRVVLNQTWQSASSAAHSKVVITG
jgi:hypothetical protein